MKPVIMSTHEYLHNIVFFIFSVK